MNAKRGFAAVLAGAGTGQLILIAVTPVLSRLYSPSDIAALSVLIALASPLGMVAALRWDAAVPLPRHEREVAGLLVLGVISVALCTTAITLVLLAAPTPIAEALGITDPSLLVAVPPIILTMGTTQLLTQLALRNQRYVTTGRSKAAQAAATGCSQISLPFLRSGGAPGLLIGYVIGQVVGAVVLLPELFSHARRYGIVRPGAALLRRYAKFPLLLVPSTFINAIGRQLPVLLVATAYSATDTGSFAMAMRIVTIPITVVGLAAGQVFLGTMATTLRASPQEALRLFDRSSRYLLAVALAISVILVPLGPTLFAIVLGETWRTSGEIARFLALLVATQLVASPLASTLTVLERPGLQFLLDSARVIGLTTAFQLVLWQEGSILAAAFGMSLVSALFYFGYWHVSRRQLLAHSRDMP